MEILIHVLNYMAVFIPESHVLDFTGKWWDNRAQLFREFSRNLS